MFVSWLCLRNRAAHLCGDDEIIPLAQCAKIRHLTERGSDDRRIGARARCLHATFTGADADAVVRQGKDQAQPLCPQALGANLAAMRADNGIG